MIANRLVISCLQRGGRGGDNSSQAQESRCAKRTSGNDHRSAKGFVQGRGKSKRTLIRSRAMRWHNVYPENRLLEAHQTTLPSSLVSVRDGKARALGRWMFYSNPGSV